MQKSVASTHEYLPTVEYSCKSFTKEVESTYSRYTQSKKALKYHSQVVTVVRFYVVAGPARDAAAHGHVYSEQSSRGRLGAPSPCKRALR